jgi:hypothetical protein
MRNVPAGSRTTPPPAEAAALIARWIVLVLSVVVLGTAPVGGKTRVDVAPDAEQESLEKLDAEELADSLRKATTGRTIDIPITTLPTTTASRPLCFFQPLYRGRCGVVIAASGLPVKPLVDVQ